MANTCCSPCFLPENEEKITRLREMVKEWSRTRLNILISRIEYGFGDIEATNPQQNISGTAIGSLDIVKSSKEFGRQLVDLLKNRAIVRPCKVYFLEKLSCGVKKVVTDLLKEEDSIGWEATGLSVVAYMIDELKKLSNNRIVYVQPLLYMFGLMKFIRQQNQNETERKQKMLSEAVQFIVLGSLLSIIRIGSSLRGFSDSLYKAYMDNLEFQVGYTYPELTLAEILEILPSVVPQSQEQQYMNAGAVSIEQARDEVIGLLGIESDDRLRIAVDIYGLDGIGKTTIANELFKNVQLTDYKVSRLEINRNYSEYDIKILQGQLLRDLFGKSIVLGSCVEGRAHLSNAFREASKPVFIFIDNLQGKSDLDNLLPAEWEWLPENSKILITSRKEQLDHIPNNSTSSTISDRTRQFSISEHIKWRTHLMMGFDVLEAKNFLRKEVLGSAEATFTPKVNIDSLTSVCKGIPLALRMVASYLRQNGDHVSACNHLLESVTADSDICGSVVDFIYSRLEEPYKEAFLDIAIFFNKWERHKLVCVFQDIQFRVLEEAGLIMISPEGKFLVHNVVRERAVTLSGNARITDEKQLEYALQNESIVFNIKGIWLSERQSEFQIEAEDLERMRKLLRVLYLGKSININGECKSTFEEVRFYYIDDMHCLPVDLHNFKRAAFFHGSLKKEIDFGDLINSFQLLESSEVSDPTNLSRGLQLAKSLHVVELSGSPDLDRLPQVFNLFSSLEELDLSNCVSLEDLPRWLGEFKSLYRLKLRGCSKLKTLPGTLGDLSSLQEIDCADCSNLVGLPASFGQLQALYYLQLRGCSKLVSLPKSFGNLSCLEVLDLSFCKMLESLPNSFDKLSSLSHLHLQCCSELKALPENFGNLFALEELDLSSDDKLTSLPDTFGRLKSLRVLKLCCSSLTELPVGMGGQISLQRLTLTNCERLTRLPETLSQVKSLKRMHLEGCSQITELPLPSVEELEMTGCSQLIKFPDNIEQYQYLRVLKFNDCSTLSALPSMFGKLHSLESLVLKNCISLKSLPASFRQLKSLRHLSLRGASKLTMDSQAAFPVSLETVDLGGCSSLQSLPQGFGRYRKLKSLLLDGCSKLPALPDGFGGLSSLRYLNIAGCVQLQQLSADFVNLTSLEATKASDCKDLQGPEMDKLVGIHRLKFVDIRGSRKLKRRWKKKPVQPLLVMYSETMYTDVIFRILSPSALSRTNVLVWLTMCDQGLDWHASKIKRKVQKHYLKDSLEFVRVDIRQSANVNEFQMDNPVDEWDKGGRDPKICQILAYAILGWWKSQVPGLFTTMATLRTSLLMIDFQSPTEKRELHIEAIVPAIEKGVDHRWIDPKGGFTRILSPLVLSVLESVQKDTEPGRHFAD